MLFIFRKLRRSFFLPGKVRTYCAYAAGEIVLIVVGILLALQISEWNQGRKDGHREAYYLRHLLTEMRGAQDELTGDDEYRATRRNALESLFAQFTARSATETEMREWILSLENISAFYPPTSVLDDLISSGDLRLLSSDELRLSINAYVQEVPRLRFAEELSKQRRDEMMVFLNDHMDLTEEKVETGTADLLLGSLQFKNHLYQRQKAIEILSGWSERMSTTIEQLIELLEADPRSQTQ